MNARGTLWRVMLPMLLLFFASAVNCPALTSGDAAPDFALEDLKGNTFNLAAAKTNPMTVLFFFDAESRASQEALMTLDKVTGQYKGSGLVVWGITRSDRKAAENFIQQAKPSFPVLMDPGAASKAYNAKLVLPVVCTLDPELKVIDYYQGGGKTIEQMMVRLAQRQLNRRQPQLAAALGNEVSALNPQNDQARALEGYAALKEGNLEQASAVFDQMAAGNNEARILGQEGQAAVLAQKGQADKALALVAQIEAKAPERGYTQMIKGDVLSHLGKTKEAGQAYTQAVAKKDLEPFQKAEALNRMGQYQARLGKFKEARNYFDQAVDLDPFYLEPTSNKGVTYEKEGQWDQALKSYRKALTLDAADTIAAALARKAEDMLAVQKDQQRKQRIDKLVKELAERYRGQAKQADPHKDTWTTRPMVVSFVDFEEKGGLSPRDGFSSAMVAQLGELLKSSGRVKVVERALLERLLEELNLGTSELADSTTALKLGQVLAAKLISTGSVFYLPNTTMLSMRLIDTETTLVPRNFTATIGSQTSLDRQLFELNRELLNTIIQNYPLRGFVVQAQGDSVMLNLGSEQGVVKGTRFAVLEEAETIEYKGRKLQKNPKTVAELEVVSVDPDLCQARIIEKQRDLRSDDKIQEVLRNESRQ